MIETITIDNVEVKRATIRQALYGLRFHMRTERYKE